MSIGYRIEPRGPAPSPELVDALRGIPTPIVSDNMGRLYAGGAVLRPFHDGTPMIGVALTVRTRPGDNLMVHKALDMAQPGDVIVVDAGGELTNSIFGEIMLTLARRRRLAGLVIDGAVRDSDALAASSIGVYARGVSHRGPYKDGPGEINVAIAIDGMVVEPGDLILGDDDGLLAVPFDAVEAVHAAATQKAAAEAQQMARIAAGTHDAAWVDAALRRLGCAGLA